MSPLHLSFTAPPSKCSEEWQRETRKVPTAPSILVGYVPTNIKMSYTSANGGLDGVKEGKCRRQSPQWPSVIHPFFLPPAALRQADETTAMQAA